MDVEKIEITYVDLDILTFSNISCIYFDSFFEGRIKTKSITNKALIREIMTNIDETVTNNRRIKNVDVRFKMKIYYKNGTTKLICGSQIAISIDCAKPYLISKKFMLLLRKVMADKQSK